MTMLRRIFQGLDPIPFLTAALVVAAAAALILTFTVSDARADTTGGIGDPSTKTEPSVKGKKAKLTKKGKAIPPEGAPPEVVAAIKAGNKIRRKPYIYGGGHKDFKSKGYDCSGAVSYVLHGAGMLDSPLDSGSLMRWGKKGKGEWITVFAHGGHTYMKVAGLRFDTSGTGGNGPRWQKEKRSKRGFTVRHFKGF